MWGSWSYKRIAWSLRKASLPIKSSDLVLDVGSGSNPHPAADVLLERYVDPKHRYDAMVVDRPTVLADACKMPFRDKAFDYSLAFHVLEHLRDPSAFLNELQRVSKAGYIETPNALFERIVPYEVHLLEIMNVDEVLVIHKKRSGRPDEFLNELKILENSRAWNQFFYANPHLFHVRYHWQDTIKFKLTNPETSLQWAEDPGISALDNGHLHTEPPRNGARGFGLSLLRKYYKLRKRQPVNLSSLLVCPECHGVLNEGASEFICSQCSLAYARLPVPDFNIAHPVAGLN
jgi:SAM-dependent methyltransferase